MNHLTALEFVDLLDGQLAAPRARHVETCDTCRAQLVELRRALSQAAEAPPPEPSPLFWEHLSKRIREGIDSEPKGARGGWQAWLGGRTGATLAAAAAALILALGFWATPEHTEPRPAVASLDGDGDPLLGTTRSGLETTDEGWAAVRAAAEDLGWDDAHEAGVAPRPGSVERAMGSLSEAERERLMLLLAEEIKRAGA